MIKPIKLFHSEKSRVFFTSDTHFCHNKEFLYIPRGYKNIEDHDVSLKNKWNAVVRPEDTVIHTGDFMLGAGRDPIEKAKSLFRQLNGHIYFIWGNHNSGVKQIYAEQMVESFGRDDIEVYPLTWENVTFVGESALFSIKQEGGSSHGQYVFASHFAHRIWIDMARNVWHVSGHSHGSDKESNPAYPYGKRLDVGIDNFGVPIDFDYLKQIMDKKQFAQIDHHDKNINPSV